MDRPVAPVVIQQWPDSGEIVHKVPTAVTYRAGRLHTCTWGFGCFSPKNCGYGLGVIEYFKYFLDKGKFERYVKDNPGFAPDIGDVRRWFVDFLRALHDYIAAYLERPPWQLDRLATKVEFVIGLPTLWKERDELICDFKNIVEQAGFKPGANCDVIFRLTEAEASAVYTAKSLGRDYREGDVILVCDAGGGTTDVCVLRVRAVGGGVVELEALDEPRALYAGSIQIDNAFEKYAVESLVAIRLEHRQLPDYTERDMARSKPFQDAKLAFGTSTSVAVESIPVPGLSNVAIKLPQEKLKEMFDGQLQKIIEVIDTVLKIVEGTEVRYLVLAGGLGSSRYVQKEMEVFYNQRGISVLYSTDPIEPSLAGCKGLVIDHMQRKDYHTAVITNRPAGTSFGILCSDRYNKARHSGQPYIESQLDSKKYVTNRIEWFIRKGGTLPKDRPIAIRCFRVLALDNLNKTWAARLVRSGPEQQGFPGYLHPDDGEVQIFGQVSSDLGPGPDITRKLGGVLSSKCIYVEYEILVSIKQENLDFKARVVGDGTSAPQQLVMQYFEDRQSKDAKDGNSRFQNEIFRHLK
ncbi:hypothetical protein GP486_000614 [Trichoglossum hirsutum]|uniref:Uncharacterized protein n=1 Tax=Trichoglossum hirsutum TaxID=265104 RepID=A0A9P8LI85_9PEZI|nr:hypothetical protein GP486_000614 [Trichoglossum hirsutum]